MKQAGRRKNNVGGFLSGGYSRK